MENLSMGEEFVLSLPKKAEEVEEEEETEEGMEAEMEEETGEEENIEAEVEAVLEEAVEEETPVWVTGTLPARSSLEDSGMTQTSTIFRMLSTGTELSRMFGWPADHLALLLWRWKILEMRKTL